MKVSTRSRAYYPKYEGQDYVKRFSGRRSPDPYRVLGLTRFASGADIRNAYLDLIKRYHPDRAPEGMDSAVCAAAINDAFHLLGRADRRAVWDGAHWADSRHAELLATRASRTRFRFLAALATLALTLGALAWLYGGKSALDTTASIINIPRLVGIAPELRRGMSRQAALDLDLLSPETGAPGAERYSRHCFADVSSFRSLAMLFFCGAIDARGGQVFLQQGSYFDKAARKARFLRAATRFPIDAGAAWADLEAEAFIMRSSEPQARPGPDVVRNPKAAMPRAGLWNVEFNDDCDCDGGQTSIEPDETSADLHSGDRSLIH